MDRDIKEETLQKKSKVDRSNLRRKKDAIERKIETE